MLKIAGLDMERVHREAECGHAITVLVDAQVVRVRHDDADHLMTATVDGLEMLQLAGADITATVVEIVQTTHRILAEHLPYCDHSQAHSGVEARKVAIPLTTTAQDAPPRPN